ncbi:MAG: hypothetical protein H6743_03785 [Rickettsiaceae bacterium]|nr:hypothetical protein [Rickettsiaceae bacterium]
MPIKFDNLLKPKETDKKKKSNINFNKLLGNADFKPIPAQKVYTVDTEAAKKIFQSPAPSNQDILALGLGPIKPELATKIVDNLYQRPQLKQATGYEIKEEIPKLSIKEEISKAYDDAWAIADLHRLVKQAETEPVSKITAKDVVEKYSGQPDRLLPFLSGVEDIKELVKLRGAVKRAENDETTPQDDLLLYKYAQEQQKDSTFGAQVANVLLGLPSFAGEFMLTAGTYAAGKKVAEEALTKVFKKYTTKELKEKLGVKILTSTIGATVQAPIAGLTRIPAGTVQRMLPEYEIGLNDLGQLELEITKPGDTLSQALAKAYGDQWVEVVSERSGGLFTAVNKSARDGLIKLGLLKSFLKANPTAEVSAFNQWVRRAGWNGILNEMGEERLGEVGRAIIGLEEYQLPTPEQLAVELVSFSIPGVAINAFGKANIKVDDNSTPTQVENQIKRVEAKVNQELSSKKTIPITEIKTGLLPIVEEKINKDEEKIKLIEADIANGKKIPAIPVFYENGEYVLNKDGYHRFIAQQNLGVKNIDIEIQPKTQLSASAKQQEELQKIELPQQEPLELNKTIDDILTEYKETESIEAVQRPITSEGKLRKSRVYDRVKNEIATEFSDDVSYSQMNIGQQAALAINFLEQQPVLALEIALGTKPAPAEIAQTAISIAVANQAKEKGNNKLYAQLVQARSYQQTRRGQEIVLERISDPDSADYFIKQALRDRLNTKVNWKYNEDGSATKRKKAADSVKTKAKSERKAIDKKAAKILEAQKIIDSLLC